MATDLTAPTTLAAVVSGHLGNNDFYTTPVAIGLSATDPDNAPASLTTFYKVDSGLFIQGNSLTVGDGVHTISFYSVDPAGNVGPTGSQSVNVDMTVPTVTAVANPSSLFPPNHKFLPITVSGHVTDTSGGVPTTVNYQVVDEYGKVQPSGTAAVDANGNYSFVVPLQSSRLGQDKDGRLYTITVTTTDQAGNVGSATTFVTVPHDQGHHSGNGNNGQGHGGGGKVNHGKGHGNHGHGRGSDGVTIVIVPPGQTGDMNLNGDNGQGPNGNNGKNKGSHGHG